MNKEEVVKIFWSMVDSVKDKWEDALDNQEADLLKILNLVKENLEYKTVFENLFMELIDYDRCASDILQFCMHDLKWNVVRNEIEKKCELAEDPREISVYQDILNSFSDDWEDKILYRCYSD